MEEAGWALGPVWAGAEYLDIRALQAVASRHQILHRHGIKQKDPLFIETGTKELAVYSNERYTGAAIRSILV